MSTADTAPADPAAIDPSHCPLCGADNACAMQSAQRTGQPVQTCWCVNHRFTPALLAQLPEAARAQACICAACVARGGPPS